VHTAYGCCSQVRALLLLRCSFVLPSYQPPLLVRCRPQPLVGEQRLTDTIQPLHTPTAGAIQCQACRQVAFCSSECAAAAANKPWVHAAATCKCVPQLYLDAGLDTLVH